jgi:hypothetical protein
VCRLLICILLTTGLLTGGCRSALDEKAAVTEVLEVRSKALNSRDITLYFSVISKNYRHKDKDFVGLKDSLSGNFKTFESLSFQPGEKNISIHGKNAEADGTYRMKVVVRGKEMVLDGVEHLILVKEHEGWKIIAGL